MKVIIYLDLDGVIVNFAKGIADHFGIPYAPEKSTTWGSVYEITGTENNHNYFWDSLKNAEFWENLEKYSYADELIEELKSMDFLPDVDICLLTSPAAGCAGYRQNWIQKNLPEFFKSGRYLIGPGKECCARRGAILIDDYPVNIKNFSKAGGMGIIFPQPWNGMKGLSENRKVLHITREIRGRLTRAAYI